MTDQTKICVGAILGGFGTDGEVRLKSFCADPAAITEYGRLTSEDGAQSFEITGLRGVKGGFAARIDGVRNKDQADALKGIGLYAERSALPSLPDDEFYHSDLIGLDVFDTGGEPVGKVINVFDHGAGDMLEISGPATKGSVLMPFTRATTPTVDLATGRIIIDPPAGVFPEQKDG